MTCRVLRERHGAVLRGRHWAVHHQLVRSHWPTGADGRLLVKLKSVPLPCPKEGTVEQLNACLFQENSDVLIFFWF